MKPIKKLLLLYCLIPILIYGQNIDTKHLVLNLQFDWLKNQAKGTAEITFSVIKKTNKIYLDAGNLTVDSIEFEKLKINFNYTGGDADNNLEIFLNKSYKPIETITIKIYYKTNYENHSDPNAIGGSFGKGLRFFQPTSTTPNKHKQIWSSGEPENNKYWFPCNEDIADIHTTEIFATVEKPLMAIGNGNLFNLTENQNGTQTFHYKSDMPFPNYLIAIVVGEYTNIIQQSGKTTINNYGYEQEKEAVKATTVLLPDMLSFLEQKTGYNYPFLNYSQIAVQDYPFPGLVGQNSLAIISDNYVDDYGVHKDFKYLWDGVAMQALANQWFGNLIMPKNWEDIWLNNAFAQYFAGIYTAKDNGNAEYFLWYYPFEKGNVLGDWDAKYKHPIVPKKISEVSVFTNDNYSKFRGALVLRMLQSELGEANWWKAVQYFVKNNANKQASTKDFQIAVEKVTGKSYQWFFDQWVYKIGLPKFEIVKIYDAKQKQLAINVKQIHSQENSSKYKQVKFFEGKIFIEIDNQIKPVFLKSKQENVFVFENIEEPGFVNFNFEQTFLCKSNFNKTKEEYLKQLKNSKDVLAKQEAINQLVVTVNDSNTDSEFKIKFREALTNEIQSNQYWRYRMLALSTLTKIVAQPYDTEMIELLKTIIQNEKQWLKSTAIGILGRTADSSYAEIYMNALHDESDRVINSAAIALGKTKCSKAFETLLNLENQTSWKNQNRISALNGLQQLGDDRAVSYVMRCIEDNHSPRWYLATATWDYPFAAVNALVSLDSAALAFPVLFERFKKSLLDNDINDIFQNVQLIILLTDARAKEVFALLKEKYKNDTLMMETIKNYENQYLESIKK